MAKVKITGHASGSGVITVTAPNTSTDRTITLPDATATIATTTDVAARLPSITDGGNATAITIDSSERIGIGTASPAATLHVKGTASTTNDLINAMDVEAATTGTAANGVGTKMTFYGSMSGQDNIELGQIGFHNNNVSGAHGDFVVRTRPNGTSAEQLRITSNGRGLSQFTAKAWGRWNGTGTIAVQDSHNLSSVTDGGTGNYSANFSNNMANANYAGIAGSRWSDGQAGTYQDYIYVGSCKVGTGNHAGADADQDTVTLVIFGD